MYMCHVHSTLCRVYNARDHPKVRNGVWTEDQAYESYLKNFDSPNDPDGVVSGHQRAPL